MGPEGAESRLDAASVVASASQAASPQLSSGERPDTERKSAEDK